MFFRSCFIFTTLGKRRFLEKRVVSDMIKVIIEDVIFNYSIAIGWVVRNGTYFVNAP